MDVPYAFLRLPVLLQHFFSFQSLGKLQRLQHQIACPYFIVQGLGADHFRRQKQLMLSCVAHIGIQRPFLLVYDPLSKSAAFTKAVWLVAVCSMRLIYKHSAFYAVAGSTAAPAVFGPRAAFQFVRNGGGGTVQISGNGPIRLPQLLHCLDLPWSDVFRACVLPYLWYTGCDPW